MTDQFLPLLAIAWLLALVLVGVAAYSFGWWWRGRHEEPRRWELERRLRREWEWNRRLAAQEQVEAGPPKLRVVE
jgi:membrane protease YdiL (CAAX protease family)